MEVYGVTGMLVGAWVGVAGGDGKCPSSDPTDVRRPDVVAPRERWSEPPSSARRTAPWSPRSPPGAPSRRRRQERECDDSLAVSWRPCTLPLVPTGRRRLAACPPRVAQAMITNATGQLLSSSMCGSGALEAWQPTSTPNNTSAASPSSSASEINAEAERSLTRGSHDRRSRRFRFIAAVDHPRGATANQTTVCPPSGTQKWYIVGLTNRSGAPRNKHTTC